MTSGSCESCGAPSAPAEKLCDKCTAMFALVLDPPTATPPSADVTVSASDDDAETFEDDQDADDESDLDDEAFEVDAVDHAQASADVEQHAHLDVAPQVAAAEPLPPAPLQTSASDVEFGSDEEFAVVRQPWQRKDEPVDAQSTAADEAEPLPWWERRANGTEADAALSSEPVPPALASAPAPPTATSPIAPGPRPHLAPPVPISSQPVARQDEPRRAGPRPVPRPPTPGATTRPAQPPSRRRPMYVLGGSLVVLLAAGVPLAKSWLRPMPTVVVSDFAPETPRAAAAATNADARSSVRSNAPVATPRAGASATAPAPANTPTAAKKSPDTATRQTAPRGDRAPHAILARNAHNAPAPAPAAAAPAPTAAPPPEPVVETPAPAPVETVAAIPTGPIFEMGQVDDKPRVASQVEPQLPDELRDRPLTDLVILRVLVAQNGRAADVNVLRKSKAGAALDTAVVSAVRKWSFSPARKRGQVVSCWYNVGVPLRLEGRTSP